MWRSVQLPKCPVDSRGDTPGRGAGVSLAARRGGAAGRGRGGAECIWLPAPAAPPAPPSGDIRAAGVWGSCHVTGKSLGGNPRCPRAVKQKGKKENWQSAAFAAAKCDKLGGLGGGAARAAAGKTEVAAAKEIYSPRPARRRTRPNQASMGSRLHPAPTRIATPVCGACLSWPGLGISEEDRAARRGNPASLCLLPRALPGQGLRVRIWQRPAGWPRRLGLVLPLSQREVCWPFVTPVGSELLRVQVAARCSGDSLYSRIQPTVPCSSCRELERQLLGGESPPGAAWSGWSSVLCSSACPFWSRALHAYGHVDLAEPPGLFPDCAAPVQRGGMSQRQQNLGGGGPGQLSFPGGLADTQRAAVSEKYAWSRRSSACLGGWLQFRASASPYPQVRLSLSAGVVPHPATWPFRKAAVLSKEGAQLLLRPLCFQFSLPLIFPRKATLVNSFRAAFWENQCLSPLDQSPNVPDY